MTVHELTASAQDYLKNIYELTDDGTSASTNALAARLKINPASVTGMLQKLASFKPALVIYHKYQGVKLTNEGKKAALEVIRHHRLIETWLVQALGYTWDEVHDEADRLEHFISEDFEVRIDTAMGHPRRDPHGEPIPTADLKMPVEDAKPLSALRPDWKGIIQCIKAAAQIEVSEYSLFDQNLTVKVGRKACVLGLSITNKILVSES